MDYKIKIKSVENNGPISRIYSEDEKFVLDVPTEANIKIKNSLDVKITREKYEHNKIKVQLYCLVFRVFENYSLVSAGGLLCKVPVCLDLDDDVFITIT